jgi:hypothetical protein
MERQNINVLTDMHCSPAEGSFCDEYGNGVKPAIVQDCNRYMGYVDKSDCMTRQLLHEHTHAEVNEEIVLSPSECISSEQFYSVHVLWFKIISSEF